MTVRGVRDSFETRPATSAAALAIFAGALYWGLKSAKKSGPMGAFVKGLIAITLAKKAKNTLMAPSRNGARALKAA